MSSAVGDGDFGGGGSDPASDPVSDFGDLGGNFGLGGTSASPAPSSIADTGLSLDFSAPVTVNGFGNIATTFAPALGGITSVPTAFGFDPAQSFATPASDFAGIFSSPAPAPAAAPASTIGQTLTALGSVVLGVLGIASGTPQGVIGGAVSVGNNFGNIASSFSGIGAGFSSNSPSVTPGESAGGPSDLFAGIQSPIVPAFGAQSATAGAATSAGLGGFAAGILAALTGGLQPRQIGRYAQPQTVAQPAQNPLFLLLALGAGAYFLAS